MLLCQSFFYLCEMSPQKWTDVILVGRLQAGRLLPFWDEFRRHKLCWSSVAFRFFYSTQLDLTHNVTKFLWSHTQKYSRLRCLLLVKCLVICFYLGWSGSILQIRTYMIKVGSKLWLLTCSSNITFIDWLCFEERAKFL